MIIIFDFFEFISDFDLLGTERVLNEKIISSWTKTSDIIKHIFVLSEFNIFESAGQEASRLKPNEWDMRKVVISDGVGNSRSKKKGS